MISVDFFNYFIYVAMCYYYYLFVSFFLCVFLYIAALECKKVKFKLKKFCSGFMISDMGKNPCPTATFLIKKMFKNTNLP